MSINHLKVYLCIRNNMQPTYECKMFNNFLEADNYYIYQNEINNNNYNHFVSILPICKYTPSFLHKYILNFKLANMHNIKVK